MLSGFVQPGAIRPSLFEVAAPGRRGFRDEPQVFRGMPQFEAGRELARLDVGSLGFDDGSDGGVGEGIRFLFRTLWFVMACRWVHVQAFTNSLPGAPRSRSQRKTYTVLDP